MPHLPELPHGLPVVVVGAGLAGWTTVREFRKLDTTTPVVLITQDSGDFYAKPSLSNAFAQKRTPAQLVTTTAAKMVETLNVTLLAHTQVESIDVVVQALQLRPALAGTNASGAAAQRLAYRQLVLATGAQPIRVPMDGNAAQAVRSVNSLDDFSVFYLGLMPDDAPADMPHGAGKTVVIMGAGLIGCEFANDLAQAGHRVHVVDPSARPLAALLPEQASAQLHQALSALGVVWHWGTTVRAVDTAASGKEVATPGAQANGCANAALRVHLANGEILPADAVLSAIGLRPDTRLASAAGLACERGVMVDAYLQTTAPAMYALGDCAQYACAGQRTLPYVMPIMHAAKALAATLAGSPTPVVFGLMPVSIKTPALPIVVASAHPAQSGAWVNQTEASTCADGGMWHFIDPDGTQRGFVLSGKHTARRMEQSRLTSP